VSRIQETGIAVVTPGHGDFCGDSRPRRLASRIQYSDTLESELNPFQNPVRVPKQIFPFKIIETGLTV